MKAFIFSLLLMAPMVSVADESPDLLETKISFDGDEFTISELFEYLGSKLDPAPNVVLKGDVGGQTVSRLVVKDVPMGNLFRVVETVADVNIEIIDSAQEQPSDDPFASSPGIRKLTSSGIIVVSSRNSRAKDPFSGDSSRPVVKQVSKVETEVIPVAELKIPVEALIDAIRVTWTVADSKLEERTNIVFHEASKLLILSGPKEAIETAQKTAAALIPSYRQMLNPEPNLQPTGSKIRTGTAPLHPLREPEEGVRAIPPAVESRAEPSAPKAIPLPQR